MRAEIAKRGQKSGFCPWGHPRSAVNTYVAAGGNALCRVCNRVRARKRRRERMEETRIARNAYQADWARRNVSKLKGRHLRKYGLTPESYLALFDAQGGRCAVCLIELTFEPRKANAANVDHCHATGKVRGILCLRCNTAIGYLKDSPQRARAIAAYLEANEPAKDEALTEAAQEVATRDSA